MPKFIVAEFNRDPHFRACGKCNLLVRFKHAVFDRRGNHLVHRIDLLAVKLPTVHCKQIDAIHNRENRRWRTRDS